MPDAILPTITDLNRPFWGAAAEGRLELQRCSACGHLRYPISTACPVCLAPEVEWVAVSGRGTVLSFTRFHRAYHPAWEDRVRYVVLLVQLEEGPRLFSLLVGDDAALRVDDPLEIAFEPDPSGSVTLPVFRRADGAPHG
jgi:uncharacterized OB-fold protein